MRLRMLRTALLSMLALTTALSSGSQAGQTQSFEVASVRLSEPRTMASHRVTDTRLDLIKMDLRQLLWMAFEIDPLCCRDRIPGAESLGGVLVDIQATIPSGAGRKQVPGMLRSLLIQRFGLRSRVEPQLIDGSELIVSEGGIRMKEVQPANDLDRVFPSEPSRKAISDAHRETVNGRERTIISVSGIRTITEQTMYDRLFTPRRTTQLNAVRITMSELAAVLAANTGRPVLDRTNLTGFYTFNIELPRDAWTARTSVGRGTAISGDGTAVNEPTGVSASKAVERLGLKLQPRRVSVDTIVIEQIDRVPSGN